MENGFKRACHGLGYFSVHTVQTVSKDVKVDVTGNVKRKEKMERDGMEGMC